MGRPIRHILKSPLLWQIALAGYWIALFIGTHFPRDARFLPPSGIDKWMHVTAFGILTALAAIAWQLAAGHLKARHLWALWLAAVLYAGFDELSQPLVGRTASFLDWGADALGAALGLMLFACLRRVPWW